jgi:hypothetical protein
VNRVVRLACAVLFAGTTACSLIFSASATMSKAASVHVPSGVVWSAVGFLELLSLAGTLRWLTARTARGRAHAIVVVALAAAVTAQFGWTFYGWVGTLAPLAVVGTIHMVVETLNDADHSVTSDDHLRSIVAEPVVEPTSTDQTGPIVGLGPDDEIDWSMSERRLAARLGVSRHEARKRRAEALGEVAS